MLAMVLVVRVKVVQHTASTARFTNPFKNLNLSIVVIMVAFTGLHVLAINFQLVRGLVFPYFSLGLEMPAMMATFLLTSTEARAFVTRRARVLLSSLGRDDRAARYRVEEVVAEATCSSSTGGGEGREEGCGSGEERSEGEGQRSWRGEEDLWCEDVKRESWERLGQMTKCWNLDDIVIEDLEL